LFIPYINLRVEHMTKLYEFASSAALREKKRVSAQPR
jgi:hypothetical protein